MPQVTLRYWASLRAAAHLKEESVTAETLAEALTWAREHHSAEFAAVLDVCSAIVDGNPVGLRDHRDVRLSDGSVVELLPPFAGG